LLTATDADRGESNKKVGCELTFFGTSDKSDGTVNLLTDSSVNNPFSLTVTEGPTAICKLIVDGTEIDYETVQYYVLEVEAADHGTPAKGSILKFKVKVDDVNEHNPVFTATPYTAALQEDVPKGTEVVVLSATDEDS
jgi:hypothetical protein